MGQQTQGFSTGDPAAAARCKPCKGRGYIEHSFREWEDDRTPVLSSIKVRCKTCGGSGSEATNTEPGTPVVQS